MATATRTDKANTESVEAEADTRTKSAGNGQPAHLTGRVTLAEARDEAEAASLCASIASLVRRELG